VLACVALALWGAGCGGGGDRSTDTTATGPVTPTPLPPPRSGPRTTAADPGAIRGPAPAERSAAAERGARAYIAALNSHDGATVCAVLAPGALDGVRLPEPRHSCPAALDASIGHVEKGGFPEWKSTRVIRMRTLLQGDDRARITARVKHRFVDRSEISSEDDVIYVVRDRNRWLLAKPSLSFYRAIGVPDTPPSVLAPPR
jgi:hypothetical protein